MDKKIITGSVLLLVSLATLSSCSIKNMSSSAISNTAYPKNLTTEALITENQKINSELRSNETTLASKKSFLKTVEKNWQDAVDKRNKMSSTCEPMVAQSEKLTVLNEEYIALNKERLALRKLVEEKKKTNASDLRVKQAELATYEDVINPKTKKITKKGKVSLKQDAIYAQEFVLHKLDWSKKCNGYTTQERFDKREEEYNKLIGDASAQVDGYLNKKSEITAKKIILEKELQSRLDADKYLQYSYTYTDASVPAKIVTVKNKTLIPNCFWNNKNQMICTDKVNYIYDENSDLNSVQDDKGNTLAPVDQSDSLHPANNPTKNETTNDDQTQYTTYLTISFEAEIEEEEQTADSCTCNEGGGECLYGYNIDGICKDKEETPTDTDICSNGKDDDSDGIVDNECAPEEISFNMINGVKALQNIFTINTAYADPTNGCLPNWVKKTVFAPFKLVNTITKPVLDLTEPTTDAVVQLISATVDLRPKDMVGSCADATGMSQVVKKIKKIKITSVTRDRQPIVNPLTK